MRRGTIIPVNNLSPVEFFQCVGGDERLDILGYLLYGFLMAFGLTKRHAKPHHY